MKAKRSEYLRVRITKAERTWLRSQRIASESVSDAARRILFAEKDSEELSSAIANNFKAGMPFK